jgi:asparagine synthase (glutamine-hydrolysing)
MQGKIPDSIVKRSKQAYRAPIKSAFMPGNAPEYVKEMLSPELFRKAGVFDFSSISNLLQKIEKTGNSSEVDDMVLASVISTHLLFTMFLEKSYNDFSQGKVSNLKIIDETRK